MRIVNTSKKYWGCHKYASKFLIFCSLLLSVFPALVEIDFYKKGGSWLDAEITYSHPMEVI